MKFYAKMLAASLLFVALVVFVFFRTEVAWSFVLLGNGFFGGSLPYNLTAAETSYKTALLLDGEVEDAWHQRARIAFLQGHYDDALTYINKQLEVHGDSFMAAYYIRGLIHGYRKEWPDAERDFSKFVVWDSANWAAHNDLAWVYFSQGKFAEAEERARGGLYILPDNPWLLSTHAMALYNLGKVKEARSELLRAKEKAAQLTADDWKTAYPGNDPAIAQKGLDEFRATIDSNLSLMEQ